MGQFVTRDYEKFKISTCLVHLRISFQFFNVKLFALKFYFQAS